MPRRALVAGLGLIGGSIGLALRRRGWHVAYLDPHVDAEDASADVAAALGGAPEAVERCLHHELGWYAVQEVDELLEHLSWGS